MIIFYLFIFTIIHNYWKSHYVNSIAFYLHYLYSGTGYPCAEQSKERWSDKFLTNQLDFEEDGNVGDLNPIGSISPSPKNIKNKLISHFT